MIVNRAERSSTDQRTIRCLSCTRFLGGTRCICLDCPKTVDSQGNVTFESEDCDIYNLCADCVSQEVEHDGFPESTRHLLPNSDYWDYLRGQSYSHRPWHHILQVRKVIPSWSMSSAIGEASLCLPLSEQPWVAYDAAYCGDEEIKNHFCAICRQREPLVRPYWMCVDCNKHGQEVPICKACNQEIENARCWATDYDPETELKYPSLKSRFSNVKGYVHHRWNHTLVLLPAPKTDGNTAAIGVDVIQGAPTAASKQTGEAEAKLDERFEAIETRMDRIEQLIQAQGERTEQQFLLQRDVFERLESQSETRTDMLQTQTDALQALETRIQERLDRLEPMVSRILDRLG
jgi:hypothetical protein